MRPVPLLFYGFNLKSLLPGDKANITLIFKRNCTALMETLPRVLNSVGLTYCFNPTPVYEVFFFLHI